MVLGVYKVMVVKAVVLSGKMFFLWLWLFLSNCNQIMVDILWLRRWFLLKEVY